MHTAAQHRKDMQASVSASEIGKRAAVMGYSGSNIEDRFGESLHHHHHHHHHNTLPSKERLRETICVVHDRQESAMARVEDDFSWQPPSESELKVIEARRERNNKISSIMGQYLLKGYKMLAVTCAVCDVSSGMLFTCSEDNEWRML
ncbi:Sjoegren syndrome/scleroderma autoantigen 1 [Portunus trituberculatus]|uniref:Sjoegren syndrome/scleroderma autoantigen 1 n=1 Tax=Portunus trituberculatus TaxID=210409 RepID=A0A5B7DP61_PORTR|nr:Sjoegren syndrome/scleroderma autoantigen 1 [Portunus trituberculatus]